MSTRAETYIIYGRKLDCERVDKSGRNFYDENLLFPWCGKGAKGTLGILEDVMNGDYVLAGYCIDVGTEWDGPQMDLNEIDQNKLDNDLLEKTNIWIRDNKLFTLLDNEDGNKLYILTHYH